jgi:hypothetical protein
MDPSTKMLAGAVLIAGLPPTITGIFSVVLQYRAERKNEELHTTMKEVKEQTDGINNQLREANQVQEAELKVANRKVNIAQGAKEERDKK